MRPGAEIPHHLFVCGINLPVVVQIAWITRTGRRRADGSSNDVNIVLVDALVSIEISSPPENSDFHWHSGR